MRCKLIGNLFLCPTYLSVIIIYVYIFISLTLEKLIDTFFIMPCSQFNSHPSVVKSRMITLINHLQTTFVWTELTYKYEHGSLPAPLGLRTLR